MLIDFHRRISGYYIKDAKPRSVRITIHVFTYIRRKYVCVEIDEHKSFFLLL